MATTYRYGVGLQCRRIGRPHVAVLMFEPFPGDGYPAQREEPRSITTRPDVCSHPETPLPGDEIAGLPPLRARCQGQEPTEGGGDLVRIRFVAKIRIVTWHYVTRFLMAPLCPSPMTVQKMSAQLEAI